MHKSKPNLRSWAILVQLLKEIAAQKGISHEEIAKRTGTSQTNITRIFGLRYRPRLDIFLNIANAIGVNLFLEDVESKTDLNKAMEKAMEQLGRRPNKLPPN